MGAPASGLGGAIGGFVARHAFQAVDSWVGSGARWLLGEAGKALTATSRPELGAAWFAGHYRTMLELAAAVAVPLLLASTIQAVARQDPSHLARSAFLHLPLALLGGAVAVELVQLAVAAVDAMSSTVAAGTGVNLHRFLAGLGGLTQPRPTGNGGALPLFVAFVAVLLLAFGALLLWLELVVRAAAIEVAVLFLPLALAGLVWPVTSRWARRLAETIGALVVAKLVVVAVLALAAGALGTVGRGGGAAAAVEGTALLLLAALSPFALLRLVPMVEAGAVGHLEGAGRSLGGRATLAASVAARPVRAIGPGLLGAAGAGAYGAGSSGLVGVDMVTGSAGAGGGGPDLPWAPAPRGWALPGDAGSGSGAGEGPPGGGGAGTEPGGSPPAGSPPPKAPPPGAPPGPPGGLAGGKEGGGDQPA